MNCTVQTTETIRGNNCKTGTIGINLAAWRHIMNSKHLMLFMNKSTNNMSLKRLFTKKSTLISWPSMPVSYHVYQVLQGAEADLVTIYARLISCLSSRTRGWSWSANVFMSSATPSFPEGASILSSTYR